MIDNIDETGFNPVTPSKVIVTKNSDKPRAIFPDSNGPHLTGVMGVSNRPDKKFPVCVMFIVPTKGGRFGPNKIKCLKEVITKSVDILRPHVDACSDQFLLAHTQRGYITKELWKKYLLDHYLPAVKETRPGLKTLLLVDGCSPPPMDSMRRLLRSVVTLLLKFFDSHLIQLQNFSHLMFLFLDYSKNITKNIGTQSMKVVVMESISKCLKWPLLFVLGKQSSRQELFKKLGQKL